MPWVESLFLLLVALGLIGVAVWGVRNGGLPYGAGKRFSRVEQPFGFWVMFLVYGGFGIGLTLHTVLVFLGHAKPLPWS